MSALHDKTIKASTPSDVGDAPPQRREPDVALTTRQAPEKALRSVNWERRAEQCGRLVVAAQAGERQAYQRLLRELDVCLRRHYARRLPQAAAEDARQDTLLAIHANRDRYAPSRPFGRWVAGIARYKWIDQIRDASRFANLLLREHIAIETSVEPAINAIVVDDMLRHLRPAQARVIRLVKLKGVSIEEASGATGQSVALVKVNIHRGMEKLAALAETDVARQRRPLLLLQCLALY
jgi:RNA polymerase sigma factor (sigma-70 family)